MSIGGELVDLRHLVESFWLTRVQCAARLGLSPRSSMVSKYCSVGLQEAAGRGRDKLLCWPLVKRWVALYVAPRKSGSYAFRQRLRQQQEQAARLAGTRPR